MWFNKKKPTEEAEEKSLTALPINGKNIQLTKQDPWSEKKELSQEEMLNQYKSWSFICARLNSESIASAKIRLYATTSRGQKRIQNFDTKEVDSKTFKKLSKSIISSSPVEMIEEIYDHPALELLYEVNNHSNYFDNFQMTQLNLDLTGNAYWYIVYDREGRPAEVIQMRPDYTTVVPSKTDLIQGYIYGTGKQKSALKKQDVIRFYVPNPTNPYYGKSCIEAGSAEVSRNNLYNVYENSQLKNNGRPDFIVKYGGKLTPEDRKRLTLEWNRLYQGTNNAGKVSIMDAEFDVEKLSFNPRDMQFLQGRLFTKKDISSMFGVPYGMLDTSDELKAGLDNILSYYQRFAVLPRLRRIEETINEQFLPLFDTSGDLFFKFDDPVDDNQKLVADINQKYVQTGILSINEARAAIGYEPIEDGDEIEIPNTSNLEEE